MILAIGEEVLARGPARRACELETLGGGLNVRRFLQPAGQGGYPPARKHLLLRLMGWKHRRTESSMLDSLRRGRPTEIDFLNGLVARAAEQAGLPAPWNRAVCQLVARDGARPAPAAGVQPGHRSWAGGRPRRQAGHAR